MSEAPITKADLRREMIARRDALPAHVRSAVAETIARRAFPVAVAPGAIVSGFMPMKGEINPLPLMKKLLGAGARLALPVIVRRGQPLVMRSWSFGEPLVSGVWGIREPPVQAAEVKPDVLLVPLVAFDRAGRRLGYGGGYFDLTLARLRAHKPILAIGTAFAVQEIAAVPVAAHDAPLDLVLTEREVIDPRGG